VCEAWFFCGEIVVKCVVNHGELTVLFQPLKFSIFSEYFSIFPQRDKATSAEAALSVQGLKVVALRAKCGGSSLRSE
jgi:hypothetical protein